MRCYFVGSSNRTPVSLKKNWAVFTTRGFIVCKIYENKALFESFIPTQTKFTTTV